MLKITECLLLITLVVAFFSDFSKCTTDISKCNFFDKTNKEVKQTFYIPTRDVNMYKRTIQKMLSQDFDLLNESMEAGSTPKNVTNMDYIKKKEEMSNKLEMNDRLAYVERYRKHIQKILKNIEFKCENVQDYETKIKCNLCIYTEILNNKHIRQGQVIQIFMNECMYGFYYFDNMGEYNGSDSMDHLNDRTVNNDNKKIDDIYMSITKDVIEGNTSKINFFRENESGYHPVCYVSE